MHREDDSSFLLFIEPDIKKKSETAVVDEYVNLMAMAMFDATSGISNYPDTEAKEATFTRDVSYKGFHTSSDGVCSTSADYLLANGMITNSLAIHYLTWFRDDIPDTEWKKMDELKEYYQKISLGSRKM